jgi:hypothetical protein
MDSSERFNDFKARFEAQGSDPEATVRLLVEVWGVNGQWYADPGPFILIPSRRRSNVGPRSPGMRPRSGTEAYQHVLHG